LETDFIDLYQIHAPVAEQDEAELVDVLADLTRSGKIRAFGCCNYASWRIAEANALAKATDSPGYATVQNYFNMLARQLEAEVAPYCVRASMSVLPYHPLGGGFLTGKYRRGEPPPPGTRGAAGSPIVKKLELGDNWERISRLEQFANDRGRQMSELAIAWLISKSYVGSVIAGASNASQVEANASAATWRLDDAELTLLEGILEEVPSVESPPSAGPR
jgi:aryl-alcohol dehydrogenase-like predicted oxidoreductase